MEDSNALDLHVADAAKYFELLDECPESWDETCARAQARRIAHRLGISAATVHGYARARYRHFAVRSRSRLMSRFPHRGLGRRGGA